VADIGADHALLAERLVREGRAEQAVATDVAAEPLRRAAARLHRSGARERVELCLGDGLTPLDGRRAEVVCIAGLGGRTIAGMLAEAGSRLAPVERLVLQPAGDAPRLRLWLLRWGWDLVGEALVAEDGRLFELIAAERHVRRPEHHGRLALALGPLLLAARHPLLGRRAEQLRQARAAAVRALGSSRRDGPSARRRRFAADIAALDALIATLPRGGGPHEPWTWKPPQRRRCR
jgi:tRNA (adenine22-N1)-methyltransferase